jgi:hypothetical protein
MRTLIAAGALAALCACGPGEEAKQEAPPPPPATPYEEMRAQGSPEQQAVFAWQRLTQWQRANNIAPVCNTVRRAEPRGVVPPNIDPASIYAPHVGATVFAIQCGPQLTTARDDPAEHWLVVFSEGPDEPVILSCADARGRDRCGASRTLPTVADPPPPGAQ